MSEFYIHTKAALNRQELTEYFWTRSEFTSLGDRLILKTKQLAPNVGDKELMKLCNDTLYEFAREAYKYKDDVNDMLDILRDSYFQKKLNSYIEYKEPKKYEEKSPIGKFFHRAGEVCLFIIFNFKAIFIGICILIAIIVFIVQQFS